MEVVPAIDLRGGKCVRLYQGDYARETVYSDDPTEVAARWSRLGAARLHVVDLDGARTGTPANIDVVRAMTASVSTPVQMGGGLRTMETARAVMSLGVDRVVVGTAAVEEPGVVREMCQALGAAKVVVGIDARDGYVAVRGWTESSSVPAMELAVCVEEMGVQWLLYTDVARDGTLTEPNFAAIGELSRRSGMKLMVAGGISAVHHLQRLAEIGVDAAIVGKALYTGDIGLSEALQAARDGVT